MDIRPLEIDFLAKYVFNEYETPMFNKTSGYGEGDGSSIRHLVVVSFWTGHELSLLI